MDETPSWRIIGARPPTQQMGEFAKLSSWKPLHLLFNWRSMLKYVFEETGHYLKSLKRRTLNEPEDLHGRRRSAWDKLGAVDWPITHALALRGDRRAPVVIANALSRLGDWPIYLLILAALIVFHPHGTGTIIICAGASIALLHFIYPAMKRLIARPRPRDVEADFPDAPAPLDRYSFPSGHVMTLTAALIPIVYAAPKIWPLGVGAWAAMAWARLAIGDHYASDIAAGTMMGAAVSGFLTYWIAA